MTEFHDGNGKSPKNRLIYILVHMSILQIAIKDYLGDFSVDFVPEYLMQSRLRVNCLCNDLYI